MNFPSDDIDKISDEEKPLLGLCLASNSFDNTNIPKTNDQDKLLDNKTFTNLEEKDIDQYNNIIEQDYNDDDVNRYGQLLVKMFQKLADKKLLVPKPILNKDYYDQISKAVRKFWYSACEELNPSFVDGVLTEELPYYFDFLSDNIRRQIDSNKSSFFKPHYLSKEMNEVIRESINNEMIKVKYLEIDGEIVLGHAHLLRWWWLYVLRNDLYMGAQIKINNVIEKVLLKDKHKMIKDSFHCINLTSMISSHLQETVDNITYDEAGLLQNIYDILSREIEIEQNKSVPFKTIPLKDF